jgi:putative ABC transport system permease protein
MISQPQIIALPAGLRRSRMSLLRLSWKNIQANPFRSLAIVSVAALVGGGVFAAILTIQAVLGGLALNLSRLGADILILPRGAAPQANQVQAVRMMTDLSTVWMPRSLDAKIAAVTGVTAVTPQLYLATYLKSPYSNKDELHLAAYDPPSDFVLSPWLVSGAGRNLVVGEAVAGSDLVFEIGKSYDLDGYPFRVVDRLEETGARADQTLFISYPSAVEYARHAPAPAGAAPADLPARASAVLVKVSVEADSSEVFRQIVTTVGPIQPLKSAEMLQSERTQMIGLARSQWILIGLITAISILIIGLVFALVVNERTVEIGVLRALGATRLFVVGGLMAEGVLLSLSGGTIGIVFTALVAVIFEPLISRLLGLPFYLPALLPLAGMIAAGIGLALVSILIATLSPAIRVYREEVSISMRE